MADKTKIMTRYFIETKNHKIYEVKEVEFFQEYDKTWAHTNIDVRRLLNYGNKDKLLYEITYGKGTNFYHRFVLTDNSYIDTVNVIKVWEENE